MAGNGGASAMLLVWPRRCACRSAGLDQEPMSVVRMAHGPSRQYWQIGLHACSPGGWGQFGAEWPGRLAGKALLDEGTATNLLQAKGGLVEKLRMQW